MLISLPDRRQGSGGSLAHADKQRHPISPIDLPATSRALHIAAVIPQQGAEQSRRIGNLRQSALHLLKLLRNANAHHRLELRAMDQASIVFPDDYLPQLTVSTPENWPEAPDLVLDFGGILNASAVADLRRRGAKVVNYSSGPDYLMAPETATTTDMLPAYHDIPYDEIWVTPQVARATYFLMHTIGQNHIKVAPFVWNPAHLPVESGFGHNAAEYEPHTHAPAVSIIPPAFDAARSCLFPLLIAENVQRRGRADLEQVLVRHGSIPLSQHETYATLIAKLDISQNGIVAFQGSDNNPGLIGGRSEIHLSYQSDFSFGDDILYLCWMGYPVVHNWDLASHLGYYYRGNDLSEGSKRLSTALERHSHDWVGYRTHQRKNIARFLPSSPELIDIYSRLIQDLLD
jgi:hypothetical protein